MTATADATEYTEYGIAGLPFGKVADATTNSFVAKARLTSYQQSWPAAYLVTRTVKASDWAPAQDGGQP